MDIRKARKERGITQQELADRIGVNRATVSKYESGQISIPLAQALAIAEALDMSFYDLSPEFPKQHKDFMTASFEAGYWAREEEFHDEVEFAIDEMEARKKDPLYANLISAYRRLNKDGQREAVRHVEIIAGNPIYQRTSPADPPEDPEADTDPPTKETPPKGQADPSNGT